MEHYELVQEMGSVERMSTQDRLKHARKRRSQQLKKWAQYERQLEKESTKKRKHQSQQQSQKKVKKSNKGNVVFAPNIALLEAAARNDLNEVKRLLESGVSPDVTNEDGLTALHQCCIDDSGEMMKLLLEYNANVNACDSEMWTPLHAAATCGHVILCGHLIDRGAELLAVNADGNMPYDICEDEMTLDYIETEMSKRGITQEQIDMTRLATEHKMLADLKDYAAQGGDLEYTDHFGATPLHIAAAHGYVEVAEFLLDNHVSVDVRDNESWQPVHAAAYWAQQEILEMLVESGADLDAKTRVGETPFDLCEDPDLKQKILDLKDEIESKRSILRDRVHGSQRSSRHRPTSRNASIRRSSMRGDKSQLFKKEHKEEALHFGLNLMQDEELLMVAEEEHENVPATDLDEVTIVVTSDDRRQQPPSPSADSDDRPPTTTSVTTITVNKPTPKPRATTVTVTPDQPTPPPSAGSQSRPESQRPPVNMRQSAGDGSRKEADPNLRNPNLPQASQNASMPRESNHAPPQPPAGNLAANQGRRQSSGSTLSDLKKQRSNSRENLADMAMQNMFLESLQKDRRGNSVHGNSVGGGGDRGDKTKNGHNNNNMAVQGYSYNAADGQLRRFVAPAQQPVVGEPDDKERCCVIL